MKALGESIYSFLDGKHGIKKCSVNDVRKGKGYRVNSFSSLIKRVAALSFNNPEYVLFFRGQAHDYKVGVRTSLQPPLFRKSAGRILLPSKIPNCRPPTPESILPLATDFKKWYY